MKKKILGIFVCTLLIVVTALPVAGTIESSKIEKNNKGSGPLSFTEGAVRQLTFNTVMDHHPSLAPMGCRIAFQSMAYSPQWYDIWVVNFDGTGLSCILPRDNEDIGPSIDRDGNKIAFQGQIPWDFEICVINADGTGYAQLTDNTYYDGLPSVGGSDPDLKIAYKSDIDYGSSVEINITSWDGTWKKRLTNNNDYDTDPSISLDGTKIAFAESYAYPPYYPEIWVINSDGTGLIRLTNNNIDDRYPSISGVPPYKIAYMSGLGEGNICVINADGTGYAQLTSGGNPSISGDGTKIAFEYNQEIYVINSDGTGLTQLTNNDADDIDPSIDYWGKKVVWTSLVDGDWEIFGTTTSSNTKPNAPTITGPASGTAGTSYPYNFVSTDPDGDNVKYHIDWGDGLTEWTGFAASGTPVTVSHTWSSDGTYTIKAKAKDTACEEGGEGTLTVTMPRNRAINTPILNFLQYHPNLFPILQKLLQRLGL